MPSSPRRRVPNNPCYTGTPSGSSFPLPTSNYPRTVDKQRSQKHSCTYPPRTACMTTQALSSQAHSLQRNPKRRRCPVWR